jgi:serine phosphatase RsbU (regulator of sigma subunit)
MDETSTSQIPGTLGWVGGAIIAAISAITLFGISRVNYLLFHSLVEMIAVLVAFSIFVIAWNTRRIVSNPYVLVLGVPQLFVGGILLLHTLSYKGMTVFVGYGTNLPTQLWMVARFLAVCSFVVAGISLRRPVRIIAVFAWFGLATAISLVTIFVWPLFPAMYIDGTGLTPLKVFGEYVIVALATVSLWLVWRDRDRFEPRVSYQIMGAMLSMILAELAFTLYVDVYGALNFLGHYVALVGMMLVYLAIIETALERPYSLLFYELKRRQQEEHAIADTLQSAMLTAPPRVCSLEMGYAYVSAMGLARVGGDFYDLFKPLSGSAAFVIGDVCGKGIDAATSTTMVRTTLRSFAYGDCDPATVLGKSNDSLSHQFPSDKFATVLYGVVDSGTGRLRLATAGHPAPLLCRAGVVDEVEVPSNPPLGVVVDYVFEEVELTLEPGDTMVLFTDGLLDAGWRTGAFGDERALIHAICASGDSPSDIAHALLAAARDHAGDRLDDDVAIVVLRYTPDA